MRILAFIHGSYLGLAGLNYDEYCNMAACNAPLLREVVDGHRDIVRGIKVRMGKEGVCFRGLEPLQRAREAADSPACPSWPTSAACRRAWRRSWGCSRKATS